jgi:subtilisin family serine protease/LysM repeat protein
VHRAAAARILLVVLGVATCTRDRTGPVVLVPASLSVAAGNGQTGAAGSILAQPFVAWVTTADGTPVGGIQVAWHVGAGGGSLSSAQATTDDQGHAAVLLTVGAGAGVNIDTVLASVAQLAGPPLVFTASTVAGPASRLHFVTQPTNVTQGDAITPAVQVVAQDAFGNLATDFHGTVSIAIATNPVAGTLSGTTAVAAIQGVATFSDLRIDKTGTGYTLQASTAPLPAAESSPFQILASAQVTHFIFTVQPGSVTAGAAITPAVVVTVTDSLGAPVTAYTGPVTLTLTTNPLGATLSGTTSFNAVAGVATFSDLHLDKSGTGYRLDAAASGVTGATSAGFGVSPAAAARIAITGGNQQTAPAGTGLPIAYGVRVSDAFGNHVPGATVTWAVAAGGGSVSAGQGSTDTTGLASTVRTLGGHAGAQTVLAAVQGLADSAATFVATATPNGTISGTITFGSGFLTPPMSLRSSWSPPTATTATAPQFTPDELIVTYRSAALAAPPVGSPALAAPATVAAMASSIRARLAGGSAASRYEIRGVSAAVLSARVRVLDSTELDQVAAALRQDPAVLAVERNGIVHLDAHQASLAATTSVTTAAAPIAPSDPLYSWEAWDYGMIDLPRAWAITTGSASVLVAVVDNGIRYDHPAVAANLTHDGYDFVSDVSEAVCAGGHISNAGDGDGYDPDPTMPADYGYDEKNSCVKGLTTSGDHGLHVAGTIGAVGNDGVGTSGVNWTVRIRPVRVLGVSGSGSFYDIAQGILYAAGLPADNGKGGTVKAPSAARVINVSLGGPSGSSALHNAVIAATNAGSLVVAAAGNDGSTTALYPAAYPEALAVSAVGPDGLLASYSTHGSAIDIAAPGGDIVDGGGTYGVFSSVWNFVTNTPAYDSWDGTSMATPHVTGVAALLLAQNPSLTAAQLRSRLTTWAVDAGAAGPDNLYGAGIVNARNSLTQSLAPPEQLYAMLYDATTGRLVATVPTVSGAYSFTGLDDGNYWVYGGADENGDGQIGVAGRPWGTIGGTATPALVTVNGAGTYGASFAIAQPTEHEPNDVIAQANPLPLPGTLNGTLSTASDVDVSRVLIAQPGTYTFETSAQNGACGFALEANTELTLENSTGGVITSNDDINAPALNYCSRVTATLAAGTYYVAVSGWTAGRYRLTARIGP